MGLLVRNTIWVIALFCAVPLMSQQKLVLKKGTVTHHLEVPEHAKSRYSVYLPGSFDIDTKWPVLIGFESAETPSRLTSLLRPTAEALGYIMITSNFGQKKSIQEKVKYIADFLSHVRTLFPLDTKKMYAVGYGEDAVLTTALPLIFNELDGVIGIEDSFNYLRQQKIRKNFYYAAIVGDQNHGYNNLIEIRKYLKLKAVPAELYVYDGTQSVPSVALMTKAVSAFQIRDMINGKMQKDSVWLKTTYDKDVREVEALVAKKEFLKAHQELLRMRATYKFIYDPKPLKKKLQSISRMPEYRKEKRLHKKLAYEEQLWRDEFVYALEEDVYYNGFSNIGWWRFTIDELRKSATSTTKQKKAMAIRLINYVEMLITIVENQLAMISNVSIDQKLFVNVLKTITNPKDFNTYRKIISLSSKDGDQATALFYLEEMLKNGYQDIDNLYTIEGTLALRLSKGYNDIVRKYLKTARYQQ